MVKSIIKRIIAGIGIMLAWYFIDTNFLMVVHAESVNVNPDKICAINGTSDTCNFSNIKTFQVAERPLYGNDFGADASRQRIIWHFTGNNIKDKTYDIDFILFIQGSSPDLYPNRGYIGNGADNIYSCDIDNSRWAVVFNGTSGTTNASVDGSVMVHCSNVYLNENYFNFYLFNLSTRSNGVMAVSHATLSESVTAKQTKEIEEINDNITSEETPSDNDIGSMFESDEDTSNTPVSSLITMPVLLLEKFYEGFGTSCGSYDLGSLYGHHIILPCINLKGLLGNDLWTLIDMLMSLFLVYNIGLMCIDIYESITSLDDGFRSLYTPKHGPMAYQPKHGGDS